MKKRILLLLSNHLIAFFVLKKMKLVDERFFNAQTFLLILSKHIKLVSTQAAQLILFFRIIRSVESPYKT